MVSSTNFANVSSNGNANYNNASNVNGVRPDATIAQLGLSFHARQWGRKGCPLGGNPRQIRIITEPVTTDAPIGVVFMNVFTDANCIYEAGTKAMSGSKWKYQTQMFEQNHLLETAHIQKELMDGTYKPDKGRRFVIKERGKARDIISSSMRDKTVNHLLCDEVVTPSIRSHLQYDNAASQKDKGVSFLRRRLEVHLHRYFEREKTNDGYILLVDFSKYYARIRHDVSMRDLMFFAKKHASADAVKTMGEILPEIFKAFGEIGVDLGSQISQDSGVLYSHEIDDYIKIVAGVKGFGRYTDDTYVIHRSKDFLKKLLEKITELAASRGIVINKGKTRICKLSRPFRYLQIQYALTDSGHIIRKINPKAMTRERRKLKAYKRLLDSGKMSVEDIENCFKSWLCGHWHFMSRAQVHGVSKLYFDLFGRRVTWQKKHGRLNWLMEH